MVFQQIIPVSTRGRGTYNITNSVKSAVTEASLKVGMCNIFIQHTSASIILCENADPTVRKDLEAFMVRLVPDGDAIFQHIMEGDDDMPAHIRTILTQSSLSIPVINGQCALGTWQGIFLWEHRAHPHRRQVIVTVQGD